MDSALILASSAIVSAIVGGGISLATQERLLKRKAQIDYTFAARKRLYEAIGPLRLQLLFSARDVMRRVADHRATTWNMHPQGYYVVSTVYRLLRPLAVGQLIERQMSFADFSIDPNALELLRFNTRVERMLTGPDILAGHPGADWATQSQHLFRDNLRAAAASLIETSSAGDLAVIDFARFEQLARAPLPPDSGLAALFTIFSSCNGSLAEKPLFWLRIVGYGYACNHLLASYGANLGFEPREYDIAFMLRDLPDDHISTDIPRYRAAFDALVAEGL